MSISHTMEDAGVELDAGTWTAMSSMSTATSSSKACLYGTSAAPIVGVECMSRLGVGGGEEHYVHDKGRC